MIFQVSTTRSPKQLDVAIEDTISHKSGVHGILCTHQIMYLLQETDMSSSTDDNHWIWLTSQPG